MSDQANKTPLIDLLRNVPKDFRASWESQWADDGTPTGHTMSPVGQLCHEAAERLAELEAERDDYKDRWEQTGCTRHGAMEAAIKVNKELLKENAELKCEWMKALRKIKALEACCRHRDEQIKTLHAISNEKDQRITALEENAKAERDGMLELRAKFGAQDHETVPMWIERMNKRITELGAALRDIYTLNVSAEGYERHCFRLKDIAGKALERDDDSSD
jgi:chromosome segregation ATPase